MKICSNKKTCIHKGKAQSTDNFYHKAITKDGYDYECKDCKDERRKEHTIKERVRRRERYSMFIG